MSLITKKTKVADYPSRLLIYAAPKAGKSTAVSMMSDTLIVDLENGYEALTGDIVNVKEKIKEGKYDDGISVLKDLYTSLKEANPYKNIVFDTIDMLETFMTEVVCVEYGVNDIGDIPYGGGYAQVRNRISKLIDSFHDLGLRIILIGHRKLTVAADSSIVKMSDVSLTGKMKDVIFADMDAIGYGFREKDEEGNDYFKLSFESHSDDSILSGSRIKRLANQVVPIIKQTSDGEMLENWSAIYPE